MNAFKALAVSSVALTLGISAAGSLASASGLIAGQTPVSACEIIAPFHFTKAETAALTDKGYRVQVERSSYKYDRFLGIYNYFQLKKSHREIGTITVKAVMAPDAEPAHAFLQKGADVTMVPKREFTFNVEMPYGEKEIAFTQSLPPKASPSKEDANNANFRELPDCKD